MATMRQYMEEVHVTKEKAESVGFLWKTYYGYEYEVIQEGDRWKVKMTLNQPVMG